MNNLVYRETICILIPEVVKPPKSFDLKKLISFYKKKAQKTKKFEAMMIYLKLSSIFEKILDNNGVIHTISNSICNNQTTWTAEVDFFDLSKKRNFKEQLEKII